jgi:hypothetical protein
MVPLSGLLIGMRHAQHGRFIPWPPRDLQAYRQTLAIEAAGNRRSRVTRLIERQCQADQLRMQRQPLAVDVDFPFADSGGGHRQRRRDEYIDASNDLAHFDQQAGADALA